MAEYIDREALRTKAVYMHGFGKNKYVPLRAIEDAPAADVVEVVHGRWLKTEEPLGWRNVDCVECSVCHDSWIANEECGFDFLGYWKYCPTCGADMRVSEEEKLESHSKEDGE